MFNAFAGLKRRVLFLAIASMLMAQPARADPPAGTVPTSSPANTPATLASQHLPVPPPPPDCSKYLPPGTAIPAQIDPTIFSFRITTDGVMHDIALVKSSGNDALDKAALTCANGSKIGPMQLAGVPAELNWVRGYFWNRWPPRYFWGVTTSGGSESCDQKQYPHGDIRKGIQGSAVISFRISADGSATNVQLLQSTGAADLDQISINCVTAWRFYPVTKNSKPVEIDQKVMVGWRLWM